MTQVEMQVPANMAAALVDSRYVVTISPEHGITAFFTGDGPQLPDEVIVDALRRVADRLESTTRLSPDADQGMPTPGAGVHVHAPGVRPN